MGNNSFGQLLTITTWGESHGKAIGVVIDGCPAGIELSIDDINQALAKRAPGKNSYTTSRREPDMAEILSGVFENKTTGAPISIMINNHDVDSSKYEPIKNHLRPGHANYTYLQKYGCFDYRGGGRASARETACRVAAAAVAQKILDFKNIKIAAYIKSIGTHQVHALPICFEQLKQQTEQSPIYCPDKNAAEKMMLAIDSAKQAGDSLGGVIEFRVDNLPVGLGDPVYQKLEAKLAQAMLSIPASKGFEIGEGFNAAQMHGSEHNDSFSTDDDLITTTNHAGGTLGGISTGMPLIGRVAFKPTSSIGRRQATTDDKGNAVSHKLPEGSRHDPCVAIRAAPIVAAMSTLVIADCLLMNATVNIEQYL